MSENCDGCDYDEVNEAFIDLKDKVSVLIPKLTRAYENQLNDEFYQHIIELRKATL